MSVQRKPTGTLSIDDEEGDDNELYRVKIGTRRSVHSTKTAGKSKLKLRSTRT